MLAAPLRIGPLGAAGSLRLMEPRLLIFVVLAVAAVVAAVVLQRRRPDAPTQGPSLIPRQLDRADFVGPDRPWLVALFTSRTCDSCAEASLKLEPLACDEVAVQEVEWSAHRDLHERYGIEAVPLVVVADGEGVVKAGFVGRFSATDLWAAVAEAREAGSTPEPGLGAVDASPAS